MEYRRLRSGAYANNLLRASLNEMLKESVQGVIDIAAVGSLA